MATITGTHADRRHLPARRPDLAGPSFLAVLTRARFRRHPVAPWLGRIITGRRA